MAKTAANTSELKKKVRKWPRERSERFKTVE